MKARRKHLLVYAGAAVALAAGVLAAASIPPGPLPDGITSRAPMSFVAHLQIHKLSGNLTIPSGIGSNQSLWKYHALDKYSALGAKYCPLHTTAAKGDIRVNSTVTRPYTLGEFFAVWGAPFGPTLVLNLKADANHTLAMFVDGSPSTAWADQRLVPGESIVISYQNATA